jgi:hypothetical protein
MQLTFLSHRSASRARRLHFRAISFCRMLIVCHRMMGTSMETKGEIEDRGKLLCRKEAARYLTALGLVIAPQTLARKYHEGTGPLCTHVGVRAMYWQAHLDAYFKAQVSEAKPAPAVRKPKRVKELTLPSESVAAPPPISLSAPQQALTTASASAPEPVLPAIAETPKRRKRSTAAPHNQAELPF